MDRFFEKVPFEEYLAFFKTKSMTDEDDHWIRIQYDYLQEPSWTGLGTYELYSPNNFSISKGSSFVIPTGFRYVASCEDVQCIPCFGTAEVEHLTEKDLSKHIVIRGTADENHCFQAGDRLIKLIFDIRGSL